MQWIKKKSRLDFIPYKNYPMCTFQSSGIVLLSFVFFCTTIIKIWKKIFLIDWNLDFGKKFQLHYSLPHITQPFLPWNPEFSSADVHTQFDKWYKHLLYVKIFFKILKKYPFLKNFAVKSALFFYKCCLKSYVELIIRYKVFMINDFWERNQKVQNLAFQWQ